jgi:hypothetical protein
VPPMAPIWGLLSTRCTGASECGGTRGAQYSDSQDKGFSIHEIERERERDLAESSTRRIVCGLFLQQKTSLS